MQAEIDERALRLPQHHLLRISHQTDARDARILEDDIDPLYLLKQALQIAEVAVWAELLSDPAG